MALSPGELRNDSTSVETDSGRFPLGCPRGAASLNQARCRRKIMRRVRVSKCLLGSALVSIAIANPTDLPAGDHSGFGGSVSAGGVGVGADGGGVSVSAGGTSVSTDHGGASVSADRGGGDVSGSGRQQTRPVQAAGRGGPVGDRSYSSIGEWFEDLRSTYFESRSERHDVASDGREIEMMTSRSSATRKSESSSSGRNQVNRVVQEKSSTIVAEEGASATAEATNVNVTEQKN